jgi:hypothetical protein
MGYKENSIYGFMETTMDQRGWTSELPDNVRGKSSIQNFNKIWKPF